MVLDATHEHHNEHRQFIPSSVVNGTERDKSSGTILVTSQGKKKKIEQTYKSREKKIHIQYGGH